jgi:predicted Abi (CAAX) family protease
MSIEFPNGSIDTTPDGGVIATGPDATRFMTLLQLASALALEMTTPLKISRRGTALDAAKIQGIIPRDKRGNYKIALTKTVAAIREMRPDFAPNPRVKRAMESVGIV